MQKTELINRVAASTGLSHAKATEALEAVLDTITQELRQGNKITITGFGTFETRETKSRNGVNPATREKLIIPAGKRISFTAGNVLRRDVIGEAEPTIKKPTKA